MESAPKSKKLSYMSISLNPRTAIHTSAICCSILLYWFVSFPFSLTLGLLFETFCSFNKARCFADSFNLCFISSESSKALSPIKLPYYSQNSAHQSTLLRYLYETPYQSNPWLFCSYCFKSGIRSKSLFYSHSYFFPCNPVNGCGFFSIAPSIITKGIQICICSRIITLSGSSQYG